MLIIDTSSLVALTRYYLRFDAKGKLKECIEAKLLSRSIVIIDKVYIESKRQSGGIVVNALNIPNAVIENTNELLPDNKFFRIMDDHFINRLASNKLQPEEIELQKGKFLESADCKMLLYARRIKQTTNIEPIIITEETITPNDGKLYKKIPFNCKILEIPCHTLPDCLSNHMGIKLADIF